jgi:mono/diheme cytochrome c family protein/glucose/arabinose dehydrogenase
MVGATLGLGVQVHAADSASPKVLAPEDALRSFRLAPGFRIELVAAEPMVEAPVAMAFDPDGRLWVVELRGYMPDIEGRGEEVPSGRVAILEDTNDDGRMDKRTTFLDGLVLPRALAFVDDGVLVAEPPRLWFCRDTNGDDRCDDKTEVSADYATASDPRLGARKNPEHASNGLLRALDNWIYSANHAVRYRRVKGMWQQELTQFRGQWGLTQDDYGRLFYNSNADQLRADLLPAHYLRRNPHLKDATSVNHRVCGDQTVWPGHPTPAVNRGGEPGVLREDGTLTAFTSACGPCVYRAAQFPPAYRGTVFVCEPAANLVRCNRLSERDGIISGTNAFGTAEFLVSTDERFRPVNIVNGPEGALYVADMHRGVIQHHLYTTPYLKRQIENRGLAAPLDRGRIYRVLFDGGELDPRPKLSKAAPAGLLQALVRTNGWWQDTAQRLLVERGDSSVVPLLARMAGGAPEPATRMRVLWTLEGLGALDERVIRTGMGDWDGRVHAAAIRLAEPLLKAAPHPANALLSRVLKRLGTAEPVVQAQLALTLGEVGGAQLEPSLVAILNKAGSNALVREAVASSLRHRELEFLGVLFADRAWAAARAERDRVLGLLASCVFHEGRAERVAALLELAAAQSGTNAWRKTALLEGLETLAEGQGSARRKLVPVRLESEPQLLKELRESNVPSERTLAERVAQLFAWPVATSGEQPTPGPTPLSAAEQGRFNDGQAVYGLVCAACHQPDGVGMDGRAPPLAQSAWVAGPEGRLGRILLHGLRGPVTVNGQTFNLEMPSFSVLSDEQIAAVLTYIRREWGHTAAPVEPATIAKIRAETAARERAWTEPELLQVP